MDFIGVILNEVRQGKTNTIWYHLYVKPENYNILVNITKNKQTHRYREQISCYQWREEREGGGNIRIEEYEVQTLRYKISYKDIMYNAKNIANIFNNYK